MFYKEFFLEDMAPIGTALPDVGHKTPATLYVPDLTPEIDTERRFPLVVVCPGGGYRFTSDREAEPLALRLLGYGIAALVVRYAIAPVRYPMQLLQVSAAIAITRRNADSWHIDPKKIFTMGFSAGGHAAAAAGVLWQEPILRETLPIAEGENRPDGMVLAYPVISSGEFAHRDSFTALLGEFTCEELLEKTSLEKGVNAQTPPAFIWHTANDNLVPVENSTLLAQSFAVAGVPFELHIYPSGVHGLSLCDDTTSRPNDPNMISPVVADWFGQCVRWLKSF